MRGQNDPDAELSPPGGAPTGPHGDLLAPHEVMRLFAREDNRLRQLLFVPDLPPVICQKAYYDKFPVASCRRPAGRWADSKKSHAPRLTCHGRRRYYCYLT